MNPLYYEILKRENQQKLKYAERERLTYQVIQKQLLRPLHQQWAYDIGAALIGLGQRLKRFGMSYAATPYSSPHH